MNNKPIRKCVSISLIAFLVIAGLPFVFDFSSDYSTVKASDIIVDQGGGGDYTTIQAAVNAAAYGDTIFVWAGTYNENVAISQRLNLIGNGSSNTTINAGANWHGIYINANQVKVNGFKLINAYTSIGGAGIKLYNSDDCEILNCNASNNDDIGIYLQISDNNIIKDNLCSTNVLYGIKLFDSNDNTIENNTCIDNKRGIRMSTADNNIIKENQCLFNDWDGIRGSNCDYNTFQNNICNNNPTGFNFSNPSLYNLFVNNTCYSNSIGISMGGLVENIIRNNSCYSNSYMGIIAGGVDECIIENNNCSNNDYGLYMSYGCWNNLVTNNTILSNDIIGIYLEEGDDDIFINNTLDSNYVGFNLISDSDRCLIINTTITNSTTYDIRFDGGSQAIALNCSFNVSNINYIDSASNLTVQWYKHVNVTNTSALPISGADIVVKDNTSNVIFSGPTDTSGWRKWIVCTEYIENQVGKISILTPHNVSVDHPLYEPGYAEPEPTMNYTQVVNIVLTLDVTAPNPPTNLVFNEVSESYLNFSWSPSNSADVEGYNIYINDTGTNLTFHLLDSTSNTFYNATNLGENTTYYFNITAYDSVPWESVPPLQSSNTTLDIPPSPPADFNFTAVGSNYLNFSWVASTSIDVVGYNIYINITNSTTSFYLYDSTSETFYNATGLDDDTIYYFHVKAYDYYPWESPAISGNSTTIDVTQPSPPTSLLCNQIGGTFINLSWSGSISIDVEGYDIYVNDTGSSVNFHYLNTATNTYFNHTGLYEEVNYYYKLKAFDEVPLYSIFSNVASTTTLDVTPPSPPTSLLITKIGGTYIELSWAASPSADLVGYELYVNDTGSTSNFHIITTTTNLNFNHSGLVEEITYYYQVRAFDEVTLHSVFSNLVFATTLDITPPGAPTGLVAQDPAGHSINLVWTDNLETDVEGYHIYVNDTGAGSTGPFHWIDSTTGTSTGYMVTGLIEETTYYFVIAAYDEVPNNSTYSAFASATTLDVTAPAMPTGLEATILSGTQISLTWNANTETDLAGYIIYMNDTDKGQNGPYHIIHTITGLDTSYTVSDLYEEITYYFRIRAYDEVPNNSLFSIVASATTPDETRPVAPSGLTVLNPTPNSLTISWDPNPEADLVGYNLSRSLAITGPFTVINTNLITGTQFIDSGLDEVTTYYYKLKAIDDVELESDFSEVTFGATLLGPHGPEINNAVEDFEIDEDTYDDTSINLKDWFIDINDDVLTFRCEGQDHFDVTIYQANGTVTLLPEENWNGQEVLTFYASDGVYEVYDEVTITVTAVNDPPGTPTIKNPKDNTKIDDGEALDFKVKCSDPDLEYGDVLEFTWYSDVSGEIGIGETLNDIILPIGKHIITVEVTDQEDETSSASITMTVEETASSDTDGDTLPNIWERTHGLDPDDPTDVDEDPDNDGLSNLEEYQEETDPQDEDSDNDGLTDGDEVNVYNTKPTRADTDRDGHDDGEDAYPLDSTKWEKEKAETADNAWIVNIVIIVIIVIIIIVIILAFLFVIRPKMGKKPEEEIVSEEQPDMGMPPAGGLSIPYESPYPPEEPFLPPQPPEEIVQEEPLPEEEPVDIKTLAREGAQAYSDGRYEDAIIAWQQVLEHEPGKHPEIERGIQDAVTKLKSSGVAMGEEDELEE